MSVHFLSTVCPNLSVLLCLGNVSYSVCPLSVHFCLSNVFLLSLSFIKVCRSTVCPLSVYCLFYSVCLLSVHFCLGNIFLLSPLLSRPAILLCLPSAHCLYTICPILTGSLSMSTVKPLPHYSIHIFYGSVHYLSPLYPSLVPNTGFGLFRSLSILDLSSSSL